MMRGLRLPRDTMHDGIMQTPTTPPGSVEIVFHPGPNGERDVDLAGRVVSAVVRALDEHHAVTRPQRGEQS